MFSIKCMMCGRPAGRLDGGRLMRAGQTQVPTARKGRSVCGACGGSLYLEAERAIDQVSEDLATTKNCPRADRRHGEHERSHPIQTADAEKGRRPVASINRAIDGHVVCVASLPVNSLDETPKVHNSRVVYDESSLEELTASIKQHGILQPILVRPIGEAKPSVDGDSWTPDRARYVVIAGNRRLRAARRAGLMEVPCVIRVADSDDAFVLNLVENLQRRELTARERVRAISLLAGLTDQTGRALGIREISQRTGLSAATVSMWLRIDRQPALMEALVEERLDIGRAMKLVSAPQWAIPALIERAASLSQGELVTAVAAAKRDDHVVVQKRSSANVQRATAAYHALEQIDQVPESVAELLEQALDRVGELMAALSTAQRDIQRAGLSARAARNVRMPKLNMAAI
jgi:ParB family chromosome partitioning protein